MNNIHPILVSYMFLHFYSQVPGVCMNALSIISGLPISTPASCFNDSHYVCTTVTPSNRLCSQHANWPWFWPFTDAFNCNWNLNIIHESIFANFFVSYFSHILVISQKFWQIPEWNVNYRIICIIVKFSIWAFLGENRWQRICFLLCKFVKFDETIQYLVGSTSATNYLQLCMLMHHMQMWISYTNTFIRTQLCPCKAAYHR